MSQSSIPPASESVPILSAILWGGLGSLFAFIGSAAVVGVIGIGMLDLTYGVGSIPDSPSVYLATLAGLFLTVFAGAQGPAYLGLLVSSNTVTWSVSIIAVFAAIYAGHQVTFKAGGPRLARQTALVYGGLIALGWAGLLALGIFAVVIVLPFSISLLPATGSTAATMVVSSVIFSALFGSVGGVLANR